MTIETILPLNQRERETNFSSPIYFGSENEIPQMTLITDESLKVDRDEFEKLEKITCDIAEIVDKYELSKESNKIGADQKNLTRCLEIDEYGGSKTIYGGLDIYKDALTEDFKVLEINPRAQAMGLQDIRQEMHENIFEPNLLLSFTNWIKDSGYQDVLVLGSRKNPFYRAYERVADRINQRGVNAIFTDIEGFLDLGLRKYVPDIIFRNCNNNIFLSTKDESLRLREEIEKHNIPIVNPLHSSYFGYRGFLKVVQEQSPIALPNQIIVTNHTTEGDLVDCPWLKLESSGEEYVINFNELRRWGKDTILALVRKDFDSAEKYLLDKNGGDSNRLRSVIKLLKNSQDDDTVWLGQSNIEPSTSELKVNGMAISMKLLYRTYWLQGKNGIEVSAECFGCDNGQYQRSKGKINAGSGYSVPVKIN